MVVFPGVPPFRNVGREGKGGGGSPGFGGFPPLARLVAAPRAHAASFSALSPVPQLRVQATALFFAAADPQIPPRTQHRRLLGEVKSENHDVFDVGNCGKPGLENRCAGC